MEKLLFGYGLDIGGYFRTSDQRPANPAPPGFLLYLPWLMYQIYLANVHVVYLVWSPRMPIEPKIIRFKTKWQGDLVLVTMANSITLTPGTITLDIQHGEFYVHALSKKVADDLLGGEMQDRVGRIYGEEDWRSDG